MKTLIFDCAAKTGSGSGSNQMAAQELQREPQGGMKLMAWEQFGI